MFGAFALVWSVWFDCAFALKFSGGFWILVFYCLRYGGFESLF